MYIAAENRPCVTLGVSVGFYINFIIPILPVFFFSGVFF